MYILELYGMMSFISIGSAPVMNFKKKLYSQSELVIACIRISVYPLYHS